jgi:hypothetical protein
MVEARAAAAAEPSDLAAAAAASMEARAALQAVRGKAAEAAETTAAAAKMGREERLGGRVEREAPGGLKAEPMAGSTAVGSPGVAQKAESMEEERWAEASTGAPKEAPVAPMAARATGGAAAAEQAGRAEAAERSACTALRLAPCRSARSSNLR